MRFSFTCDSYEERGWKPECCLEMDAIRPTDFIALMSHDFIDHGIIADSDFSQEGEMIAFGSHFWRHMQHIPEPQLDGFSCSQRQLVKLGFEKSKKRFPDGIVCPEENEKILEKLKHHARRQGVGLVKNLDKSQLSKFDINAKLVGRTIKFSPVCEEFC
jgi:hypothetical protein